LLHKVSTRCNHHWKDDRRIHLMTLFDIAPGLRPIRKRIPQVLTTPRGLRAPLLRHSALAASDNERHPAREPDIQMESEQRAGP
jgi:hypothetical protein